MEDIRHSGAVGLSAKTAFVPASVAGDYRQFMPIVPASVVERSRVVKLYPVVRSAVTVAPPPAASAAIADRVLTEHTSHAVVTVKPRDRDESGGEDIFAKMVEMKESSTARLAEMGEMMSQMGELSKRMDDIKRVQQESAEKLARLIANIKGSQHSDQTAVSSR